jgi:hypothetical protein
VTWCCAIFFLGYVGIEVALGGWIVKFMLEVRKGENFASGMTATGFWMGITVGRLVLGFVTPRIGEKMAIAVRWPTVFLVQPHFTDDRVDLPPAHHGPRAHLLARTTVLRLRRGSRAAGLLPRASLSCRCRCCDQVAAATLARQRHWVRSRNRRVRRCNLPLRRRSNRAGKRRAGPAADYSGAVGLHSRGLALLAQISQEAGVARAYEHSIPILK